MLCGTCIYQMDCFSDYFEMILNTVFIIWGALGTVSGNKVNLEQTFHFEITLMAP